MLTKEEIIKVLEENDFKSSDTILIHSSLKSLGPIEGGSVTLIDTLKEYFKDGLVIFPTHTWSFMNSENQTLDLNEANSCVGALTNIALQNGYIRSFHPTHSVCAYGKNAESYLACDDFASTPVNPNGCFGVLGKLHAKIIFIGCPLSKNTFIHSIEEKYNVSDRFTSHIYHFYSKKDDIIKEYYVRKHYSTLNPHISNNYVKLEKPFEQLNISNIFMLGLANCLSLDAYMCENFVSYLLEKNIHIFDDEEQIDIKLINEYEETRKS